MHPFNTLDVPEGKVAIHWFEQSSFAIKDAAGTVVLVDPYFPHDRPGEKFIHPAPPLDEKELRTDYILLTHAHTDHTHPETIRRIAAAFPDVRVIGPEESIRQARHDAGINEQQTTTIRAGGTEQAGSFTVHAVYAKPPEGDPKAGIKPPDVTHLGYVLDTAGITLYFSGDPIHTFPKHDALVEAVASLKPQIGFLTNHPTEGEFPFFEGSAEMARKTGLKTAVPVHRACFVKRDYDPQAWASHFKQGDPEPLIIDRNSHIIYPQ